MVRAQQAPADVSARYREQDLFRARLDDMFDPRHPLVRVGEAMLWQHWSMRSTSRCRPSRPGLAFAPCRAPRKRRLFLRPRRHPFLLVVRSYLFAP